VAIQPLVRPITSTTITRLWASAVLARRSMASEAIWTAVSNPKVTSVPLMSLSMVLGTPMIGSPSWLSFSADARVPSPPTTIRVSMPFRWMVRRQLS
jgi:hypothetical protein